VAQGGGFWGGWGNHFFVFLFCCLWVWSWYFFPAPRGELFQNTHKYTPCPGLGGEGGPPPVGLVFTPGCFFFLVLPPPPLFFLSGSNFFFFSPRRVSFFYPTFAGVWFFLGVFFFTPRFFLPPVPRGCGRLNVSPDVFSSQKIFFSHVFFLDQGLFMGETILVFLYKLPPCCLVVFFFFLVSGFRVQWWGSPPPLHKKIHFFFSLVCFVGLGLAFFKTFFFFFFCLVGFFLFFPPLLTFFFFCFFVVFCYSLGIHLGSPTLFFFPYFCRFISTPQHLAKRLVGLWENPHPKGVAPPQQPIRWKKQTPYNLKKPPRGFLFFLGWIFRSPTFLPETNLTTRHPIFFFFCLTPPPGCWFFFFLFFPPTSRFFPPWVFFVFLWGGEGGFLVVFFFFSPIFFFFCGFLASFPQLGGVRFDWLFLGGTKTPP